MQFQRGPLSVKFYLYLTMNILKINTFLMKDQYINFITSYFIILTNQNLNDFFFSCVFVDLGSLEDLIFLKKKIITHFEALFLVLLAVGALRSPTRNLPYWFY